MWALLTEVLFHPWIGIRRKHHIFNLDPDRQSRQILFQKPYWRSLRQVVNTARNMIFMYHIRYIYIHIKCVCSFIPATMNIPSKQKPQTFEPRDLVFLALKICMSVHQSSFPPSLICPLLECCPPFFGWQGTAGVRTSSVRASSIHPGVVVQV